MLSGGLLAGIAVTVDRQALRRWRSVGVGDTDRPDSGAGGILAAGLTVYALTTTSFYDRYLWPLAFAVVLLAAAKGGRLARRLTPSQGS